MLICTTMWVNLKSIKIKERSRLKATYCRIPFWKRQNYKDKIRSVVSSGWGWGRGLIYH